ncbi:MAG: 3-deoxy-D-manno-octulosonic acid transferase [Paludibacteraceae bacterium]|nr:3-deoxy-D-manno-octulosonic acid transferase [Paludibacteraceae bacterium]
MWFLYEIGIRIYSALIWLAGRWNAKARKRAEGGDQLSQNADRLKKKLAGHRVVWFHAASLGEFEQARPVMERWHKEHEEWKIVLTFFSPSGYEIRKDYALADEVLYLPMDTRKAARLFMNTIKPEVAIYVKYEIWANMLREGKRAGVKSYLISAYFRESQLFFKPCGSWYASLLRYFDEIFVQEKSSKALLESIGIEHVAVSGDTRYDRVTKIAQERKNLTVVVSFKGQSKMIVAGSSWGPDEDLLIPYAAKKGVKLLLAPHEIDEGHLETIERMVQREGMKSLRYTEADEAKVKDVDVLIINNFGMLSSVYYYADVAYVGGGFGVGIHNTLEAAVYGVPVVWGPNYLTFDEAKKLVAAGGGFSVDGKVTFEETMNGLLADGEAAGTAAGKFVAEHTGATDVIFEELRIK